MSTHLGTPSAALLQHEAHLESFSHQLSSNNNLAIGANASRVGNRSKCFHLHQSLTLPITPGAGQYCYPIFQMRKLSPICPGSGGWWEMRGWLQNPHLSSASGLSCPRAQAVPPGLGSHQTQRWALLSSWAPQPLLLPLCQVLCLSQLTGCPIQIFDQYPGNRDFRADIFQTLIEVNKHSSTE